MTQKIAPKYVVPNLVTLVGLSFGMVAIARSLEHDFATACWWIVLCTLFDKLDGFAARRLHAESEFGVQMDSLSDLVTFCVSPAVLLLAVSRAAPAGSAHWTATATLTAALAFVAAGALRLARFNVHTDEGDPTCFQGFPTTFCGGLLAVLYLVAARHGQAELWLRAAPIAYVGLAILMVSSVPVPKFRKASNPLINGVIMVNLVGAYVVGLLRVVPEYLLALIATYLVFGGGWVWVSRLRGRSCPDAGPAAGSDRDGTIS